MQNVNLGFGQSAFPCFLQQNLLLITNWIEHLCYSKWHLKLPCVWSHVHCNCLVFVGFFYDLAIRAASAYPSKIYEWDSRELSSLVLWIHMISVWNFLLCFFVRPHLLLNIGLLLAVITVSAWCWASNSCSTVLFLLLWQALVNICNSGLDGFY